MSPANGTVLTSFALRCDDWTTDASLLPLAYSFAYAYQWANGKRQTFVAPQGECLRLSLSFHLVSGNFGSYCRLLLS